MSGKLKEVKNRIESVKKTQQITKAMKLVAASKLKKATDMIVQMRPYESKLSAMMANLVEATQGEVDLELAKERDPNKVLLIVITSDKGLCGAFNTNVVKMVKKAVNGEYAATAESGNLDIMYIGKKAFDVLKRTPNVNHIQDHIDLFRDLNFQDTAKAIETVMDQYSAQEYDKIMVYYSRFRNAAVQIFTEDQFLPIKKIEAPAPSNNADVKKEANNDYLFEPSKEILINELVPKILKTQFYRFLLDSNASEHGARMTAMENATENANELLRDLKISYNKERQAAITTELTEIVSGAAALEGA